MTSLTDLKEEQVQLWNGAMGKTWVEAQAFIDGMLRPLEELIVATVSSLSPKNILDVGCGNGTTTLALAHVVAPQGRCNGIDISAPMIENARSRASSSSSDVAAEFICADASDYLFGDIKFDVFTSRFGVMFFADPVAAFTNLRSAAAHQAQLAFLVWRAPEENDFLTTAQRTAVPLLPQLSARESTSPGAFALANPDHVHSILTTSGWTEITLHPVDQQCTFASDDLDLFLTKLAPIGHDIEALDEDVRAAIAQAIRSAYEQYIHGDEVHFKASCWLIRAHID
ncbi:MAG: class I SAM-dependent methyltransferase [Cyanobacteria bacterium P01_D01_bin.115]